MAKLVSIERIFSPGMIDLGLLVLRLWFGAMMIYHGQSKLFGDIDRFTAGVVKMGLPSFMAWAAILAEFVGGILIIIGWFTPLALAMVSVTMAVAAFIRHGADPFGRKELPFTYLVLAVVLLLTGPGRYSVDAWMMKRRLLARNKQTLYS